ncbi:acyl-CoA dehydrogenase [Caulobacter sp. Root1455]|nr:acyl-CoA dehydrogenase [Caulobacter sp. Root1455]
MVRQSIPFPSPASVRSMSDEAFLALVSAFLAKALTPDLRAAGRRTLGVHSDIEACRVWHAKLFARGWIAPAWPEAWGGTGWSPRQRFLFDRECALNDAPVLFAAGLRSLGPLLIEQGDDAQRARYLPPILSGQDLWCQGFSEPGAGSDLAAVSCRAVRHGDVYRITGTKIWTTGAHLANRMFGIFRTADGARRQQGLTFLLVDMNSPGLTVSPILDLARQHDFNQVFFDDVPVAVADRVGAENDGWSMAKRLMQLARANNTPAALVRRALRRATEALNQAGPDVEPGLRTRLAGLSVDLDAFEQLELAVLPSGRPGPHDPIAPSMLKLVGTQLHQQVAELAMEIVGNPAAAALGAVGVAGGLAGGEALDAGALAMARRLSLRAATIYSGASEMQRDVIARHLLGAT